MLINFILIVIVLAGTGVIIMRSITKKKEQEAEQEIEVDDKTYTLDKITAFVKRRLDEITKINLYDIGLSEEELQRRKLLKDVHMVMLMIRNM